MHVFQREIYIHSTLYFPPISLSTAHQYKGNNTTFVLQYTFNLVCYFLSSLSVNIAFRLLCRSFSLPLRSPLSSAQNGLFRDILTYCWQHVIHFDMCNIVQIPITLDVFRSSDVQEKKTLPKLSVSLNVGRLRSVFYLRNKKYSIHMNDE